MEHKDSGHAMKPSLVCRAPTEKEKETLEDIAKKTGHRSFSECRRDLWRAEEYLILLGKKVIGYAGLLVDTTGWYEELTPEIQAYILDPKYYQHDHSVRRLLEKELKEGW